jgi:hypothetical protein
MAVFLCKSFDGWQKEDPARIYKVSIGMMLAIPAA